MGKRNEIKSAVFLLTIFILLFAIAWYYTVQQISQTELAKAKRTDRKQTFKPQHNSDGDPSLSPPHNKPRIQRLSDEEYEELTAKYSSLLNENAQRIEQRKYPSPSSSSSSPPSL